MNVRCVCACMRVCMFECVCVLCAEVQSHTRAYLCNVLANLCTYIYVFLFLAELQTRAQKNALCEITFEMS